MKFWKTLEKVYENTEQYLEKRVINKLEKALRNIVFTIIVFPRSPGIIFHKFGIILE